MRAHSILGFRQMIATLCAVFFLQSAVSLFAQSVEAADTQNESAQQLLSANQLDNLVAPIALYPDPLISQVLVADTYPLELVQAQQWLQRHPELKGSALTEAAQEQDWDPSVQALLMFPDVMKRLNDDIEWTTSLGNAFLAQQADVMTAIQRVLSAKWRSVR